MGELTGRTALVTGAASGIGAALADELYRRGARLILVDVDAERLTAVAERTGGRAHTCDLSDADAIAALAPSLGEADMLFLNAGVAVIGPAWDTPADEVRWITDINVVANMLLVHHLVPGLVARGGGHIAFTASIAGLIGVPGMALYSASKFAVVGLAEALRGELRSKGVSVTTICPGRVHTGLHKATRYHNQGFRQFMDRTEGQPGLEVTEVARQAVDGVLAGRAQVVLGPERFAVWLRRVSRRAYVWLAPRVFRSMGLLGQEATSGG